MTVRSVSPAPPRLLLLDGHSLAYRAFYALPADNFSTSTGQTTNAVYGFIAMLINLLRDEQPSHLAVAFDVSRQTFRLQEYTEYKAGRAATPDQFRDQVPLIKEVLAALRILVVEHEGYEADDLIATLTTQASAGDLDVLICSGDRDVFQLIDPKVTVLYPVKGVSELHRMTPQAVLDRYGVPPSHYSDLAALVGESSDNLPGVPGVGPKTAAKWINQYGDVHAVIAYADQLSGKVGASLREHAAQVVVNRRINGLVRNVPLSVSIDHLLRQQWDRDEVHRVFDGLEFRVLRDRLFATVEATEPEAEGGFAVQPARLRAAEIGAWLETHAPPGQLTGVEVLGSWDQGVGDIRGLAFASPTGPAVYIEKADLLNLTYPAALDWLASARYLKAMHGSKEQRQALTAVGVRIAGIAMDTLLAAYLVRPDQRSYDLADLALRHVGRQLSTEQPTSDGQLTLEVMTDHGDAAMIRARAVVDISAMLSTEVDAVQGTALLQDIELPLVEVLSAMEKAGMYIDSEYLAELEESFASGVSQVERDAMAALPETADGSPRVINLGSPKQLQKVLFDELDMPKTKRTKTGYTTDADALVDLFAKNPHPFLESLLRHRDVSRLRQTVVGLQKTIAADGRIHTTYHQTIAATGRLSSTDPNLQNIPIRTEEGRRIREAFVVGPGFDTLLSADYSQIEMRIMAHLSNDAALIEAFRSGEDLHRYVGSRVFGVQPESVTSAMRSKVKAMSYGLAYGLSAFGLSRQLRIDAGEANALMAEYFERFGGVRDYLHQVVEQARWSGYTETMLGRRRYLPDLTSDNRQRREMAERMALNAPIQGSAADIIKLAMLRVHRELQHRHLKSRLLLQVHDELVIEVAPGELGEVSLLTQQEMAAAVTMDVPLEVSLGVGRSWQAAAH
ncbi:MAG: DNA polymerase I [Actinomycetota bacterium]